MTFGRGLNNFAVDQEATAQKCETRLLMFLAEWFLDTSAGLPWTTTFVNSAGNLAFVEATIKACILETDGVDEIITFSMSFNSETRVLSVTATITTIYGTTENIQVSKAVA